MIEVIIRSLVNVGWLSVPFGLWNRARYPVILFESEQLNPDVFFVGNSRTRHGVDTNQFNNYYNQKTNQTIKSYNAGIPATSAYITSTFSRAFLIPDYNVDTIVWVLTATDLDGYISEFWNQQWVDFLAVPEVQSRLQSQFNIDDVMKNWWTWRFRHTIKYIMSNLGSPFTYQVNQRKDYGYLSLTEEVIPQTILQDNFYWEYVTSEIDPQILNTIRDFVQVAMNHNMKVIFVIQPTLHHQYQDGEQYIRVEDQIIKEFTSFLDQYDVAIYDERYLSFDEVISFDGFEDSSHLNQNGAPIFSRRLAEIYIQETQSD